MAEKYTNDELENFLGANFHQDIESVKSAVDECIVDENAGWLLKIATLIDEFLKLDLTEQEKNTFIEENTYIYFPAIGLTPTDWLANVAKQFKEAAKEKE